MSQPNVAFLRRVLHKPPAVLFRRAAQEAGARIDRISAGRRARMFDTAALLRATDAASLDELWARAAARPYPASTHAIDVSSHDGFCPGDRDRVLVLAERAVAHQVDLLGSGPIALGPTIDWLTDHKTGYSWPPAFMRDIEYNNLERASDVKFPWELSRLQWLIPAGQAFLLTGDERYARATRDVIEQWIAGNPYAGTVNWSCTMEAALRIVSWSWFLHVFSHSESWVDPGFRSRFLSALFLHGRFTAKYLEHSDVNGNHCTADAAGLVFAGLFFGQGTEPSRWLRVGWDLLVDEMPKQVSADGVDYEASIAYHRLVLELFLLPAMYRKVCRLPVPDAYARRLSGMARFVAAYSRSDGSTPLWGDADDARMLPLGGQALTDHRYLIGLVALFDDSGLMPLFGGPLSEIFWLCGADAARRLAAVPRVSPISGGFREGGYFIMRNSLDHVFIDCAPVGLAGRGGHGHNDCLSFEAALGGVPLVTDAGSYVYTASATARNRFRATASHNTPQIDGDELNRFVGKDQLWTLHNDAVPQVLRWEAGETEDVFVGTHTGYQRLPQPATPTRTIVLGHLHHTLQIHDAVTGTGDHTVRVRLHLAPDVAVENVGPGQATLSAGGKEFVLVWAPVSLWTLTIVAAEVSPSYGVVVPSVSLVWDRRGPLPCALTVSIGLLLPPGSIGPSLPPQQLRLAGE